ncbi:hypothetical protein QBZ16_002769 [Prototheca wickerhamii]|uniref:Uncharacterized protein n=1 Tax=Prototheca wickerhamii TaxID=3111 RepID=A0AAD9MHT8_PROWI|nr:hypothetical protein QBZ16_002769 [Prototheca wickerhamii]
MQPRNTVGQIKRLLGKRFADPAVQQDLPYLPYTVVESASGGCEVEVQYLGESTRLSPEQVLAALLVDQRLLAEREQGVPVTDAVLSVPVYFTEAERHAFLAAAQAAGLNCLRLLNDTTATALAWGIYKTDLPETEPINVVFVDVGFSGTQVCVAALKKGQVQVLSSAWDRDLGGRNFDNVLFDHFADEFGQRYGVDIRSNARASFRLRQACEKLKKVLTSNPEAPLGVECIMNDVDVQGAITREVFEAEAAGVLDRLLGAVRRAVEGAGLTPEAVHSVEVVGGSSRVPAVLRLLTDYFGREPNRTLNATETVARGCALQCAMLSPAFRVRDFQVLDALPYGVEFSWEGRDGKPVVSTVFERGSAVPSAKMLTFFRAEPFSIRAAYSADSELPAGASREIGEFRIGAFSVPAGQETAKLKVKVTLNLNSTVVVESVVAIEEEEIAPAEEEPAQGAEAPAEAAAPADADAAPDAEAPAPADAPMPSAEAEAKPAKRKVKVRRTPVPHESRTAELAGAALAALQEREAQMALQARVQEATNDAKNAVESYIYGLRNAFYGPLEKFETEEKKAAIREALEEAENWLYEEGEDETKSVYVEKLAELRKLGDPIERRAREAAEAPAAAAALRERARALAAMTEDAKGTRTWPRTSASACAARRPRRWPGWTTRRPPRPRWRRTTTPRSRPATWPSAATRSSWWPRPSSARRRPSPSRPSPRPSPRSPRPWRRARPTPRPRTSRPTPARRCRSDAPCARKERRWGGGLFANLAGIRFLAALCASEGVHLPPCHSPLLCCLTTQYLLSAVL